MKTIEQLQAAAAAKAAATKPAVEAAPAVTGKEVPKDDERPAAFQIVGNSLVVSEALVEALTAAGITLEKQEDGAQVIAGLTIPDAKESESIAALSAQIGTQALELAGLRADVAQYEQDVAGLISIAAESLGTMSVALGAAAPDVSKMQVSQLVSTHAQTAATYKSKFPVGGVAAVAASAAEDQAQLAAQKAGVDDHMARVRVVQGRNKFNHQGA